MSSILHRALGVIPRRSIRPVGGARIVLRALIPRYTPSSATARFYAAEAKHSASETVEKEATAAPEAETESSSPSAEETADPTAKLEAAYAQKDKEVAELKNLYARAVADFRNLQELTKREVQKARDFALQKFAKELLESLDNFSLALDAVKPETIEANAEVKNLYDGVSMTKQVFEKTLVRYGIEKVDPMGESFNPNLHEATFEMAVPEKEAGTVFHVQSAGYTLNGRVLRPAKVGVVKSADN